MKVLFVAPYYKPYLGGIERVIERLAGEFTQTSTAEVSVLTSRYSFPRHHHPEWTSNQHIDNEQVYRLHSLPTTAPPFYQTPLVWFSPKEINNVIDQVQPDVIQLMSDRWFNVNYWVIRAAQKRKIPVAFSLSFHELSAKQRFLRPINRWLLKQVDHIQVITNLEKDRIIATYGAPAEKIVVVPWGVDTAIAPDRPSIHERIKIISVGRISKHKGQKWLADVYQSATFTQPTELVLIGALQEPEIVKEVEAVILSSDKRIVITGEVTQNELEQQYASADVFALFPEYEAFGLVFLEAMCVGLPVLTHNVGAISEVLGDNALIVGPFDHSAAKLALEDLINNEEHRAGYGLQGREYVGKRFSWRKTANTFITHYQQLISKKEAR